MNKFSLKQYKELGENYSQNFPTWQKNSPTFACAYEWGSNPTWEYVEISNKRHKDKFKRAKPKKGSKQKNRILKQFQTNREK